MKIICIAIHTVIFLLLYSPISSGSDKTSGQNSEENKNMVLPPCASCKLLIESFLKVSIIN
jgi:hypothetical protein